MKKKLSFHDEIEKQFREFQQTKTEIEGGYEYVGGHKIFVRPIGMSGMYCVVGKASIYESTDLEELENYLFEAYIQE